jgi:hypothetical protein
MEPETWVLTDGLSRPEIRLWCAYTAVGAAGAPHAAPWLPPLSWSGVVEGSSDSTTSAYSADKDGAGPDGTVTIGDTAPDAAPTTHTLDGVNGRAPFILLAPTGSGKRHRRQSFTSQSTDATDDVAPCNATDSSGCGSNEVPDHMAAPNSTDNPTANRPSGDQEEEPEQAHAAAESSSPPVPTSGEVSSDGSASGAAREEDVAWLGAVGPADTLTPTPTNTPTPTPTPTPTVPLTSVTPTPPLTNTPSTNTIGTNHNTSPRVGPRGLASPSAAVMRALHSPSHFLSVATPHTKPHPTAAAQWSSTAQPEARLRCVSTAYRIVYSLDVSPSAAFVNTGTRSVMFAGA